MLGQATAVLESPPRSWLQRMWGTPDIHTRQKWSLIWPHLASLPHEGLRLLDAGCGEGGWALELAALRPHWTVLGVDRDAVAIARAEQRRLRLGLENAGFLRGDFREICLDRTVDVVLSIASAHYLAACGEGPALFRMFARWLRPGGLLCLLGPRSGARMPFVTHLPHPTWHPVFSADELRALCRNAGFEVKALHGCIGRAGIVAKQLAWAGSGRHPVVRGVLYPAEWLMNGLDRRTTSEGRVTLMWLLLAQCHGGQVG